MVSFMPRLWIANAEEALPEEDPYFRSFFYSKTVFMFPRFLACLRPGDCLVVPAHLPKDFAKYVSRLLGLGKYNDFVLSVRLADSCILTDSILQDSEALSAIRQRCGNDGWVLEPYMQTPRVCRLAEELGLPRAQTASALIEEGLIEQLNNKAFFKEFAGKLGLSVVLGSIAHNLPELLEAIDSLGTKYDELMLRKVKYAGGAGNVHGSAATLSGYVPKWYSTGTVLVEPFLPLLVVVGALVQITDTEINFLGLDRQVFRDGGWCGFDYPFAPSCNLKAEELVVSLPTDQAVMHADFNESAVAEGAIALAKAAQEKGARGYMNTDWAFAAGNSDKPIALECNFRHNGFGYVIDFARQYFGPRWTKLHMRCHEAVPTYADDMSQLIERVAHLRFNNSPVLITEPGAKQGAVITAPPQHHHFSIAVFGPTKEYVSIVMAMIEAMV